MVTLPSGRSMVIGCSSVISMSVRSSTAEAEGGGAGQSATSRGDGGDDVPGQIEVDLAAVAEPDPGRTHGVRTSEVAQQHAEPKQHPPDAEDEQR